MVFLGAVLVALPIVLIMLLVNLCIGIVTRAAPALNIFAVGFPAMVLIGLLLLIAFMTNISQRIQWLWMRAFETAQAIWVL
jgi:flagellar biosynthesis protein FliR